MQTRSSRNKKPIQDIQDLPVSIPRSNSASRSRSTNKPKSVSSSKSRPLSNTRRITESDDSDDGIIYYSSREKLRNQPLQSIPITSVPTSTDTLPTQPPRLNNNNDNYFTEGLLYWPIFLIGFVLRLIVIIRTSAIDMYLPVKYTDIDYLVFSDAAALLSQGITPYDRATYRYSPLLSYIMLPNIHLHPQFGKWLFSLCDIIVSLLIYVILRRMGGNQDKNKRYIPFHITSTHAITMSLFYLFNPLSINLSTRGSMDVLHITLLYIALLSMYNQSWYIGGLFYGLAVHLRIYPFIFAIPIFATFMVWNMNNIDNAWRNDENDGDNHDNNDKSQLKKKNSNKQPPQRQTFFQLFLSTLFHPNTLKFVITCIVINILLLVVFYAKFGYQFLYETYLFHVIRKDTRHNFSPLFFLTYLRQDIENMFKTPLLIHTNDLPQNFSSFLSKFAPISYLCTQLTPILNLCWSLISIIITFGVIGLLPLYKSTKLLFSTNNSQNHNNNDERSNIKHKIATSMTDTEDSTNNNNELRQFPLPIIVFILSLWFVAKNGVITAQYFLWFIAFVPMYLPYIFLNDNVTSHQGENIDDDNTNTISNATITKRNNQVVDVDASTSTKRMATINTRTRSRTRKTKRNDDNNTDSEDDDDHNQITDKTPLLPTSDGKQTKPSSKPSSTHIEADLLIEPTEPWFTSQQLKTFSLFILSCLLWLVTELLWLSSGYFVEVRGIGHYAWIWMQCTSIFLFGVHTWIIYAAIRGVLKAK